MNFLNSRYQNLDIVARIDSEDYQRAQPFPSIVYENFFNPEMLNEVLAEFPDLSAQQNVTSFSNKNEKKFASKGTELFGSKTQAFVNYLNSPAFVSFLQNLTGINERLIPDHEFLGGGLHEIKRGGFLKLHADFNKNSKGLDRRLNILVYLNKDWNEEYGGHFELWNKDRTKCMQKISPVFNTLAIFSTTSTSWHGHPDPLNCPDHRSRKSLALYYYSDGRPEEERTEDHTTRFVGRRGHKEGSIWERLKGIFG